MSESFFCAPFPSKIRVSRTNERTYVVSLPHTVRRRRNRDVTEMHVRRASHRHATSVRIPANPRPPVVPIRQPIAFSLVFRMNRIIERWYPVSFATVRSFLSFFPPSFFPHFTRILLFLDCNVDNSRNYVTTVRTQGKPRVTRK